MASTAKASSTASQKAKETIKKNAAKKRAAREQTKIDEAIKVLNEVDKIPVDDLPKYYTCVRCGKRVKYRPADTFYHSSNCTLFDGNDGYIHICKECLNTIYDGLFEIYRDKRIAMVIICSLINVYFSDVIFEQHCHREDFTLGFYLRQSNLVSNANRNNTFSDYVADLYEKAARDVSEVREDLTKRWNENEIANRNRVIKALGYEPFADKGYLPDELRFLYNTAASYLSDDVLNDAHKLQQVIILAKQFLDVERISKRITERFNNRDNDGDTRTTKDLVDMRNSTIKVINDIAAENGISAKKNGAKKADTLTSIMNEMLDVGVDDAKINIVKAKLSKSYQEISVANAKALFDELNFTSDDYARMLAEQAEIVTTLQKKVDEITELLRLKTIDYKQKEKELFELQAKLKEVTENDINQ